MSKTPNDHDTQKIRSNKKQERAPAPVGSGTSSGYGTIAHESDDEPTDSGSVHATTAGHEESKPGRVRSGSVSSATDWQTSESARDKSEKDSKKREHVRVESGPMPVAGQESNKKQEPARAGSGSFPTSPARTASLESEELETSRSGSGRMYAKTPSRESTKRDPSRAGSGSLSSATAAHEHKEPTPMRAKSDPVSTITGKESKKRVPSRAGSGSVSSIVAEHESKESEPTRAESDPVPTMTVEQEPKKRDPFRAGSGSVSSIPEHEPKEPERSRPKSDPVRSVIVGQESKKRDPSRTSTGSVPATTVVRNSKEPDPSRAKSEPVPKMTAGPESKKREPSRVSSGSVRSTTGSVRSSTDRRKSKKLDSAESISSTTPHQDSKKPETVRVGSDRLPTTTARAEPKQPESPGSGPMSATTTGQESKKQVPSRGGSGTVAAKTSGRESKKSSPARNESGPVLAAIESTPAASETLPATTAGPTAASRPAPAMPAPVRPTPGPVSGSAFDRKMPVASGKEPLIGVIDAGTRTIKFCLFKSRNPNELVEHAIDIKPITPQEGWHEQDPYEIINAMEHSIAGVAHKLPALGYKMSDIKTIGITNQRETTIVWDKTTGQPLYNAIVWNDIRTDDVVDEILGKVPDNNKNHFKQICGLPISPYFSAFKLIWMIQHVAAVRKAIKAKKCMFGTVDTWILWNLTGGTRGGVHLTDVTNASRTFLMNIETLHWDPLLMHTFSINADILPEIRSSSQIYGMVLNGGPLDGIPISGILGNQQAALVGQNCFKEGQAKNTYRSGCFLLYNTGTAKVNSTHGLVTTVAYKFGDNPAVYALEGSVSVAGAAINWLRDNMGLIGDVTHDTETLAHEVMNTGDVYFVPAFNGLYAPYWRKDARGIICGLTAFTTKKHIIRAALEAVCFQTRDILEAMDKDCGIPLTKLHVDGRMTTNNLLMQLQADISGIPVFRSQSQTNITALGAAMAAGSAQGIDLWDINEHSEETVPNDTFLPTTTEDERDARYKKWKMAVQRSLGWASSKKSPDMTDERYKLLSSIPASLYLISSFGLLVLSKKLIAA